MSHSASEDVTCGQVWTDHNQGSGGKRNTADIPGLGPGEWDQIESCWDKWLFVSGDGGGQDDPGHRGGARGRRVQIQRRVRQMGRPVQVYNQSRNVYQEPWSTHSHLYNGAWDVKYMVPESFFQSVGIWQIWQLLLSDMHLVKSKITFSQSSHVCRM